MYATTGRSTKGAVTRNKSVSPAQPRRTHLTGRRSSRADSHADDCSAHDASAWLPGDLYGFILPSLMLHSPQDNISISLSRKDDTLWQTEIVHAVPTLPSRESWLAGIGELPRDRWCPVPVVPGDCQVPPTTAPPFPPSLRCEIADRMPWRHSEMPVVCSVRRERLAQRRVEDRTYPRAIGTPYAGRTSRQTKGHPQARSLPPRTSQFP